VDEEDVLCDEHIMKMTNIQQIMPIQDESWKLFKIVKTVKITYKMNARPYDNSQNLSHGV
jgi:hypothetical protein